MKPIIKPIPRNHFFRAFTLLELIILVAVIAILAFVMSHKLSEASANAKRIQCVGRLKNIGLAFRIFATDHRDRFPPHIMATNGVELTSLTPVEIFRVLSNEISTPVILYCPADRKRKPAADFATLKTENLSYFINLNADESRPQTMLSGDRHVLTNGQPVTGLLTLTANIASTLSWSREMHLEQGSVAMGDGSVSQLTSHRLQQAVPDQEIATNYLAFP